MQEPELLLGGLMFPEGPRWRDGRLWFSDQHAREVVAVDAKGRRETIVEVPGHPSGLGWLPDGTLLIVSMNDRKLLRWDGTALARSRGPVRDRGLSLQRHGRRRFRPRVRRKLRLRHVRRRRAGADNAGSGHSRRQSAGRRLPI